MRQAALVKVAKTIVYYRYHSLSILTASRMDIDIALGSSLIYTKRVMSRRLTYLK